METGFRRRAWFVAALTLYLGWILTLGMLGLASARRPSASPQTLPASEAGATGGQGH